MSFNTKIIPCNKEPFVNIWFLGALKTCRGDVSVPSLVSLFSVCHKYINHAVTNDSQQETDDCYRNTYLNSTS